MPRAGAANIHRKAYESEEESSDDEESLGYTSDDDADVENIDARQPPEKRSGSKYILMKLATLAEYTHYFLIPSDLYNILIAFHAIFSS
jgi:hypothetical protein